MTYSDPPRRRSFVVGAGAAAALLALAALASCSDDDSDPATAASSVVDAGVATTLATTTTASTVPPTTGAPNPENAAAEDGAEATDADVAAGLRDIATQAQQLVATVEDDPEGAQAGFETMLERWRSFQGAVRTNEPEIHNQLDNGIDQLRSALSVGDAVKADNARLNLADAADSYLAVHPG